MQWDAIFVTLLLGPVIE